MGPRMAAPGYIQRLGREQKLFGELAETKQHGDRDTISSGNFRAAGALGPRSPAQPGACISLQVITPGSATIPRDE